MDPLSGLLVNHIRSSFDCDFVLLDSRIQSIKSTIDKSFTLGSTEAVDNVNILQSYNGLLLYTSGGDRFDYVYKPSTNLLKCLCNQITHMKIQLFYGCAGLRMEFDPTKPPYDKVARAGSTSSNIVIQIYSSEIGNWSLCREQFNFFFFVHFDSTIYWNDVLHWLENENRQLTHYKLNIEDHKHPIITTIQIPQGLQQGRNFFESYGNMLLMIITIQIPYMLHLEGKLFGSRGCLLLVCIHYIGSSEFTIYEMRKWFSVWSIKYLVDTNDFMNLLLERWSIRSTVWSFVLGERDKDSFLMINLSGRL
ncbi:hypothetical protein Tco_0585544 [Tanacetum coccineum]